MINPQVRLEGTAPITVTGGRFFDYAGQPINTTLHFKLPNSELPLKSNKLADLDSAIGFQLRTKDMVSSNDWKTAEGVRVCVKQGAKVLFDLYAEPDTVVENGRAVRMLHPLYILVNIGRLLKKSHPENFVICAFEIKKGVADVVLKIKAPTQIQPGIQTAQPS